jgi:hypothetical protein
VLPALDQSFLADRGIPHEVRAEGGMICVVLANWPLPPGYGRPSADLLIRIPSGYPDLPPDMWWFDPPARLADGSSPPATESTEQYLGRSWQRWSRHFQTGQWKSGVDGLESYVALRRSS